MEFLKSPLFITGTDTNVGKTYVTCLLLDHFNRQGFKTLGIKPIASGVGPDGIHNEDSLALQSYSSIKALYDIVNPFCFKRPIAPHIASEGTLSASLIQSAIKNAEFYQADILLVEGAGGFCIPLNHYQLLSDAVADMPVLLVVGMKLGCLNHAILTANQIPNLWGWVANCLDPSMEALDENIETLRLWVKAPLRGIVPFKTKKMGSFSIEERRGF